MEERYRALEDIKIRNNVFGRKSQCLWKKGRIVLSAVYDLYGGCIHNLINKFKIKRR